MTAAGFGPLNVTGGERAVSEMSDSYWKAPKGAIMRVFIAGGTGIVGQHLVPLLTAASHEVTATTRSPGKAGLLRTLGATSAVVDGLDAGGLLAAVHQAMLAVIIHQMSEPSSMKNLRRFDREFAATNKLRTAGTDNLLAPAQAAGTRHFMAQSHFLAHSYADLPDIRGGGPVKAVEDPLLPTTPPAARTACR